MINATNGVFHYFFAVLPISEGS